MRMSNLGRVSPVANAISKTLGLFYPERVSRRTSERDGKYLILSYRNPDDFAFLWNFWGDDGVENVSDQKGELLPNGEIIKWASSSNDRRNIVVVWDGLPNPSTIGNVNLESYLTPFDWLVSFGFALSGVDRSPVRTQIRIDIIDLVSTGRGLSESALLFRQLQSGPSAMLDGIRVYELAADGMAEQDLRKFVEDSLSSSFGQDGRMSEDTNLVDSVRNFGLLKRIWRARLLAPSDPRDRHAIANLLGPQLLISAMTSWSATAIFRESSCLAALLSLMRILGLFPSSRESVMAPWMGPDKWKKYRFDAKGSAPVFVLIDDMHHLGWADFLRLALGIPPHTEDTVSLILNDAPDMKGFGAQGTNTFLDLLKDETGQLRVNKGIHLLAERDAILFLDLRLFNQRTLRAEIEFFKSLLVLARQVDEHSQRKDLPWMGFTSQEIQAVENVIASGEVESDDYLIALTFLPRLLALVDPMLPIILFSSTGQRRISEALKGYGNIVSDFDKPRFFGEVSDSIVENTHQRFERALTRALMLLRGRLVCRNLQIANLPTMKSKKEHYIEIFIDEAGEVADQTFRVGGVAIVYEDENQAQEFNLGLVNAALTWGSTDIERNPPMLIPKRLPSAKDYQANIYDPVDHLLAVTGVNQFVGFSLTVAPDRKWIDSTDLTSPWCLDNLYRSLLGQSLEVLFYEVLPEKIGQDIPDFNCAVYVASRKRCQSDADAPRDWDRNSKLNIHYRYGIMIRKDQDCENGMSFQSVTSDNVYPIVAQVRALMPAANIAVLVARGNQLRYQVDKLYPESLPRPAHLLADPIVSLSRRPEDLKEQPSLARWLANGFTSVSDERFTTTLTACRHARAGRHIDAIVDAHQAINLSRNGTGLDPWAKARIGRSVDQLSGWAFVALCSRLSAATPGDTVLFNELE
jgi:hypothetical protein